ncbi:hypothetical protein [Pseudaestuariivita rosea]|uniref:hypothetical protein n=1 Tax=Pseudaestuariivita rosea TaxID=2763263 RepID=UPI001ABA9BC4|nr:hypothetical protein [Pseudaestuariivita rosea]
MPVYKDYNGNLFYAPYEIIPDHPQCNGPDKIAFRAQLTAEDVNFRIYDVETRDFVTIARGKDPSYVQSNFKRCFQILRRGSEHMRIEIPCSDGQTRPRVPALQKIMENESSFGLKGEITVCKTLHDLTILDSNWQTAIVTSEKRTTEEGTFAEVPDDWTAHPQYNRNLDGQDIATPDNTPILNIPIWSTLHYLDLDVPTWATLYYNPANFKMSYQSSEVGYTAAQFRATLSCIPVYIQDSPTAIMFADATIFFNLTPDTPQTCTSKTCEGLRPPRPQTPYGFGERCFPKLN